MDEAIQAFNAFDAEVQRQTDALLDSRVWYVSADATTRQQMRAEVLALTSRMAAGLLSEDQVQQRIDALNRRIEGMRQ